MNIPPVNITGSLSHNSTSIEDVLFFEWSKKLFDKQYTQQYFEYRICSKNIKACNLDSYTEDCLDEIQEEAYFTDMFPKIFNNSSERNVRQQYRKEENDLFNWLYSFFSSKSKVDFCLRMPYNIVMVGEDHFIDAVIIAEGSCPGTGFEVIINWHVALPISSKELVNDPLVKEDLPEDFIFIKDLPKDKFLYLTVITKDRRSNLNITGEPLENVSTHYNEDVYSAIEKLIKELKGIPNGKLVFLHGPPGTGKTHLMKCIFEELKNNYQFYIVGNPLHFFNKESYMGYVSDAKRNMFLFEDADTLVSKGARDNYPDLFSALANYTNGFIGAGRNDVFVFTFNREVSEIDNALLRSGRCLANVYVGAMDNNTIKKFNEKYNLNLKSPITLADAFAEIKDKSVFNIEEKRQKIGF